jgi:hypothetical protein
VSFWWGPQIRNEYLYESESDPALTLDDASHREENNASLIYWKRRLVYRGSVPSLHVLPSLSLEQIHVSCRLSSFASSHSFRLAADLLGASWPVRMVFGICRILDTGCPVVIGSTICAKEGG